MQQIVAERNGSPVLEAVPERRSREDKEPERTGRTFSDYPRRKSKTPTAFFDLPPGEELGFGDSVPILKFSDAARLPFSKGKECLSETPERRAELY